MAALGSRGNLLQDSNRQIKSVFASPEKVRELLNDVVSEDNRTNRAQGDLNTVASPNGIMTQAPCEAANKDAFFTRVESYSCLKWAGKPRTLSPLRCASYGWVNVSDDMLKCSSCEAFLCVSLQPTLDYEKYESRLEEITGQLQTQHAKFCPWPDFPCPDRFWLVPASEPSVLLSAFIQRFQSACLLEQQLPAMKPETLKTMSLTEDVISILLQLIEDEHKKQGRSPLKSTSEASVATQVAACIVALCGWAGSPALHNISLPILTCTFCMRKVGLWNFHQMEATTAGEGDSNTITPVPSTPPPTPLPAQEGRGGDGLTPTSPSPSLSSTPSRMKLRSQDTTRSQGSDQAEGSLSPLVGRKRSRDSPSPSEEPHSPLAKGKRPATRGRGPGDGDGGTGGDCTSSPLRNPNRLCLVANSFFQEGSAHRNVFDPLLQHRHWCPWVNGGKENTRPAQNSTSQNPTAPDGTRPAQNPTAPDGDANLQQQGWKAALKLLLPMKKVTSPVGSSPAQDLHDKSKRVFAIFRQWQVASPVQ